MIQRISIVAALVAALLLSACARQYNDPPARQTSLIHPPPVAEAEPSPPEPVPMPAPAFPTPQQKPGSEMSEADIAAAVTDIPAGTPDAMPERGSGVAPEAAANATSTADSNTTSPTSTTNSNTTSAVPVIERNDPKRLVGLNEAQTIGLLGDPFIAEERPPARIWTFADGGCRLQVFFYPDLSDQHFEALTVSFSGIADTDAARRACFEALLEKHGA